jgi:hypothetical protein
MFSPDVARFYVFGHRLAIFRCFRCNMGQRTCPRHDKGRLPVSMFSPIAYPISGVSAVTRGNVRVHVKLSVACPFLPDVARFHVFAHRLAICRRFRCNTGQSTCPCHFKRRLPIFARRRLFLCFHPSLSRFQAFPL